MLHEDTSHNDFSVLGKANLFMWAQTSIFRNTLCCNRVTQRKDSWKSNCVYMSFQGTLYV